MATQEERRAETRKALLDAAAELFAHKGVESASVDAIAAVAGRTSGALYDHFGSKEGLLFALLDAWVVDVSAVIGAELATADTLEERMATLWRNISSPVAGDGRWIALEHELWTYATRNDAARKRLVRRYRAAWDSVDTAFGTRIGPALIATLLGLEMMRRLDPDAVTDDLAIAALCGIARKDRRHAHSPL